MGKRAALAPSGIVTSDSVRRPYLRRPQLLLAGVVVVVLLAAAGGVYVLRSGLLAPKPAATPSASLSPAQQLAAAQIEVQQAQTKTEKASAFSNLGAAYQANNQYSQAATAYQQSVDNQDPNQSHIAESQTISTLSQLNVAYLEAGQTDKAVQALQQIVSILQQSKYPDDQQNISLYQSMIDAEQKGIVK